MEKKNKISPVVGVVKFKGKMFGIREVKIDSCLHEHLIRRIQTKFFLKNGYREGIDFGNTKIQSLTEVVLFCEDCGKILEEIY